jgi:hypothetical protein
VGPSPAAPESTNAGAKRAFQHPLGIGLASAGVIGLGVGVLLGFAAKAKYDDSNKDGHCNQETNACDSTGKPLRDSAYRLGNIGTAVGVGGAIFAAAGALLWITAQPAGPQPAGPQPAGPQPAGPQPAAAMPLRIGVGLGSVTVRGVY